MSVREEDQARLVKKKTFMVVAVSSNCNSFGLHNVVMISRDGVAVKGLKTGQFLPQQNSTIELMEDDPLQSLTLLGYECPEKLTDPPEGVVTEVWKGL